MTNFIMMVRYAVWAAGIFHRIISGDEGSISINFLPELKNLI